MVCASCTDKSYDWDNRDMMIQLTQPGETLWLPNSSTSRVMLSDLFCVEEGENLKIIDDPETDKTTLFCLQADGDQETSMTLSSPSVTWTSVTLADPTCNVRLDNMPSFLNNEDNCFDVKNPLILLKVTKNNGIDIKTRIRLTSKKNGETLKRTETGSAEELVVTGDRSGDNAALFYISESPVEQNYLPEEYRDATHVSLSTASGCASIQELLRDIPDLIYVEFLDYRGMGTTTSCSMHAEYLLYAPMRPDSRFVLSDDDISDGMNSDLKDMTFRKMLMQATVIGDLPMKIRLEPTIVDENGDKIDGVETTIGGNKYVEVMGDKSTPIVIDIHTTNGGQLSQYTKRDINYLDGIRFKFTVKDPRENGAKIYSDNMIRLVNIRMGVQEFGFDAN